MDVSRSIETVTLGAASHALIVEFAGTPKAGKTTAIKGLVRALAEAGYRVEVVEEQAPLSPVSGKRDPDFNVWTVSTTVSRMVNAFHAGSQVVLVDRGVFDALCWMEWHHSSGQLGRKNRLAFDRFLLTRSRTVDLVLLMTVSPAEAIRRDSAGGRDQRARMIVRPDVLSAFNRSIESVRKRYAKRFELVHLDTTELDREATLDRVIEEVGRVLTDRGGADILRPAARDTNGSRPPAHTNGSAASQPHERAIVDAYAVPPTV